MVLAKEHLILLISIILRLSCEISAAEDYHYRIKEFQVPVDHFNYASNKTFNIRYLYNDSYVRNDYAPLFFYTGNEGDIELFAQNTGFLWELAESFQACVVFAEHRYYGKSLPFGDATFNMTNNYVYLTVEQTLEDFVCLIDALWSNKKGPVIAFGGSYGGMLAAWLRMKYPQVVLGSLAASAPIWQFNGLTSCDIYYKITTSVFTTSYNSNCSVNVKDAWSLFKNLSSTDAGKTKLNTVFKFCNPIKGADDVKKFFDYLADVYVNLAMANYPYNNEFLSPLPGFPVRQFCSYLKVQHQGDALLNAIYEAISVYTNFTGNLKCLEYSSAYDPSLGGSAWDVQTCNQIVMPMCSSQDDTMFPNKAWDFKAYSDDCFNKYKLRPNLNDIVLRYGGKNLRYASNIIFSNGLLDPWSGGGVLQSVNDDIVVIIIPEGAHHLDLRANNPSDPPSVIAARRQETQVIGDWISDFLTQKNFI